MVAPRCQAFASSGAEQHSAEQLSRRQLIAGSAVGLALSLSMWVRVCMGGQASKQAGRQHDLYLSNVIAGVHECTGMGHHEAPASFQVRGSNAQCDQQRPSQARVMQHMTTRH